MDPLSGSFVDDFLVGLDAPSAAVKLERQGFVGEREVPLGSEVIENFLLTDRLYFLNRKMQMGISGIPAVP